MKTLALFGSTGSIGTQTLEVLRAFPEDFKLLGITGLKNEKLLAKQASEFSVPGHKGLTHKDTLIAAADIIVNALPGFAGLEVSLAAVRAGKTLLSANKESLAIAGRYLRAEAAKTGAQIFPLDSEASAIWQLLHEYGAAPISSITLTCSGGPFRGKTRAELEHVTIAEALAHPTWKMGKKVSIDSATLINKILEIYEVHNLFDIPLKDIHVVVHPQSIVHSMIHTKTGATKMHITQNDMKLFISYALHYPVQPVCPWPIVRTRKSELSFDQPDAETFRSLKWFELHKGNPNFPVVLNALNDLAVQRFLCGEISFLGIYEFIEAGLEKWLWEVPAATLDEMISLTQRITNEYSHSTSRREIPAGRAK
ncbi:MAG: 1-deoxy-D-xylulose-5-phosphate reductoisomerase [Patescibacteria group bacterium]